MLSLLSHIAAVFAGLALLIWSADKFVEGAAAMAHLLGVSVMIIGITIVGFGTSAPEIVVSIVAVLQDTPDIAIGNALGSNIANIGLILGVTAILAPIPIATRLFKAEYPLLMIATALMSWSLFDLTLDVVDGFALFGFLLLSLHYLVREHRRNPAAYAREEHEPEEMIHDMKMPAAIGWLLLGLALLVGSSKLLVWGASNIAQTLGVSELIIGLTIIALGPSLPELAASIVSLKKGKPDLAIGNVIGSNMFNLFMVMGLTGIIFPFSLSNKLLLRDLPVMIGFTLALVAILRNAKGTDRWHGLLFFAAYSIYCFSLL